MKKTLLTLALVFSTILASMACDVTFKIEKEKSKYSVGDEVVVKVTIMLIHRDCKVAMKSTQFKPTGLKILSGTDWKETSKGTWERKLKLKITDGAQGKATLVVIRTCERDGGKGVLTLKL
jgi:hypothetical protein